MKTTDQTINYLSDFKSLEYKTPEAFIEFHLDKKEVLVTSTYKVEKISSEKNKLFFHGEKLEFVSLKVNGAELKSSEYELTEKGLSILNPPQESIFEVEIKNKIQPEKNLELEGLYVSGDILCTQNEPMGFRKITYSIDRPDNMVKVKAKLLGDKKEFPFMLANGNLIEEGQEAGLDFCLWEDPFPKPLYLFAIVAGDLAELTDTYTTKTGREVALKFYCDHGAENKCDFAIESLKKSMKWDEDRFNLEYDLDLYMVVAVDSFNMGAMENKGLNIFNSALVLANPETATDLNYHRIESVIGHEYFHNWTGNRVTVKNWFQLTLKEGLTVFRDQEFSSDLNDKAVERIDMVNQLKERQFTEDAGPLAHPIRPEEYKEMNNFYTSTVYEKGAEVIRMIHTFLGEEKFQSGMKEYFEKYDGKAITTEDFLDVMCSQDKKIDKAAFSNWYKTPGTPKVLIKEEHSQNELKLTFKQSNRVSKAKNLGEETTYIPVKLSIYNDDGKKVTLDCDRKDQHFLNQGLLTLKEEDEVFVFKGVPEGYQVSYFEGFSAPVLYDIQSESRDLSKLIKIDQDVFNQCNLAKQSALDYINGDDCDHLQSFKFILRNASLSSLMKSKMLAPPSFNEIIEGTPSFDPVLIEEKRAGYLKKVGNSLGGEILDYINKNPLKAYEYNLKQKGDRALFCILSEYLLSSDEYRKTAEGVLSAVYKDADNMTDSFNSLWLSQVHSLGGSESFSSSFYEKNKDDQLTLQKWISAYVSSPGFDEAFKRVLTVEKTKGFSYKIPNFVRSLWGSFYRNTTAFHDSKGRGYEAVLNAILRVDKINPQMASGLMKAFNISPRINGECGVILKAKLGDFSLKKETFSSHLKETFESIYSEMEKQ